MLSAYYVFKKGMGVSYSYSKKNWKITLKRGSNKIVMTRGNKYAYVNGKKTKMPTPARSVYSYEQKSNFIYVPGSFVQNILDYLILGMILLILKHSKVILLQALQAKLLMYSLQNLPV